MPMLAFTKFRDKLLSGEKTQTIRLHRKHPIKLGEILYIYWRLRTKQCEKLFEAHCTSMDTHPFREIAYDETIARLDGFKDSEEMRACLTTMHPKLMTDTLVDVIRWSKE